MYVLVYGKPHSVFWYYVYMAKTHFMFHNLIYPLCEYKDNIFMQVGHLWYLLYMSSILHNHGWLETVCDCLYIKAMDSCQYSIGAWFLLLSEIWDCIQDALHRSHILWRVVQVHLSKDKGHNYWILTLVIKCKILCLYKSYEECGQSGTVIGKATLLYLYKRMLIVT